MRDITVPLDALTAANVRIVSLERLRDKLAECNEIAASMGYDHAIHALHALKAMKRGPRQVEPGDAGEPGTAFATELPVDRLAGDPRAWGANLNMREWVRAAVEAKGAKFTGGGFGADMCDLDIELEGFKYNISVCPR